MKMNVRWLSFAGIAAGISAVAGLVLQVPLPQLAVSCAGDRPGI